MQGRVGHGDGVPERARAVDPDAELGNESVRPPPSTCSASDAEHRGNWRKVKRHVVEDRRKRNANRAKIVCPYKNRTQTLDEDDPTD